MTKQELGDLIIASEDMLFHIGMSMLRNETDVEDAIQSSIVRAFEGLKGLRHDRYARTWLTRIMINECNSLLRKRKFQAAVDVQEHVPAALGADLTAADDSLLYQAILSLPEEMRLTLTMYYGDEFTIREIAKVLRVSEGTVKSRLSRGRARLREILDSQGDFI